MVTCCLTITRIQYLVSRLFIPAKHARAKAESLAGIGVQFKTVNLNFRNIVGELLNYL